MHFFKNRSRAFWALVIGLLAILLCGCGFFWMSEPELPSWFPFQPKIPHQKIDLFFTVDVETPSPVDQWHPYDDKALFITGDGSPNTPTIGYIMDALEKYHYKGSFFLDVYEYKLFKKKDTIKHIAQEISSRGHEVDLHCHAGHLISGKELTDFSLPEQRQLLNLGKQLIQNWTGKAPQAFRAGGYLLNENTFITLDQLDIPMDSSVFYNHKHNQFKAFTRNKTATFHNVIELPITTARHENRKGLTKFDLNWMGYTSFRKIIKQAKLSKEKKLIFMMHSFSLLKFNRNKPYKPLEAKKQKLEQLNKILEYIAHDPDIHVVTYSQWYEQNQHYPNLNQYEPEFSPIVK